MTFGKTTGKPQNQRVEYILCGIAQSLKMHFIYGNAKTRVASCSKKKKERKENKQKPFLSTLVYFDNCVMFIIFLNDDLRLTYCNTQQGIANQDQ